MNESHPITGFAGNFIIFGACGSLATEKIYPALFALFKKDIFYHYLGYGRTKINDPAFKKLVQKSILKAENEDQITQFLAEHADAKEIPFDSNPAKYGWQILTGDNNCDGFYYARLRKESLAA